MTAAQIRKKYLDFFVARGHVVIPPAPLVLENDPTTLFTSSGMQPLVPYLLGQTHPSGKRLVNSQPSFRSQDIEEVGDNRHTTFFEMLGNWSLGDYFKKEQLSWFWEFLTKELSLPAEKLWVSVFEGNDLVPRDEESAAIWESLGVPTERIYYYNVEKNWWSRSGTPDQMPTGEPGGPDSEVFFEFTQIKHDPKFGDKCHPNCQCGRFMEIGNSVFMQYEKQADGSLKELAQKNVDFGGGLERLTAATNNDPDIFNTDFFKSAKGLLTGNIKDVRIILDHLRAAEFIINSGITPSNKQQGYLLRRLIRRSAVHAKLSNINLSAQIKNIIDSFIKIYEPFYVLTDGSDVILGELKKFNTTLEKGVNLIGKASAFDLYQTYGFPREVIEELYLEKNLKFDEAGFEKEKNAHQEKSRSASTGVFKGGLADRSDVVVKYHTATHLLHAALRQILGEHVSQKGSNITGERLRFDFSHPKKLTLQEIQLIEDLVNKKIKEGVKVKRQEMKKQDALAAGALAFFPEKYPENILVYRIGDFSFELCGGPHVTNTAEIGTIKITRAETIGAGLQRIYATALH